MKTRIFLASLALTMAAVLSQGTIAHAGESTLTLAGFGASLDAGATSLMDATSIKSTAAVVSNAGTGIYSSIGEFTVGSASTLTLSDLQAFTFTVDGLTFTSNAFSSQDTIVTQTASFLNVYLRGDFGGKDSSISLTASGSGTSIGETFTVSTPPILIPEPSSVIMGLTGVLGCGLLYVVRRRSAKAAA